MNLNRMLGVDFSMPVLVDDLELVVPLRKKPNLKMMLNIFGYEVWVVLLLLVPCYILILWVADYIQYGCVRWHKLTGFVIRTILKESVSNPIPHNAKSYQNLLIISWTLPVFVLTSAYAGSFTAMIAKPTFEKPIKDANDLVNQNEISWILTDEAYATQLFRSSPPGTVFKKLYDQVGILTSHDCYTVRNELFWKSGKYAAPCTGIAIMALMADDFSLTGKCNYYTTSDKLGTSIYSLAFQVCM